MTFDEYKAQRVGKRIDYETYKNVVSYECVEHVKHFAKLVHGTKIKAFSGSALKGRKTGSPFVGLPYQRVIYTGKEIPPRGAVIFFNETKKNPYGHVAITGTCSNKELWVVEQNAAQGDGDGQGGDEISIRQYPYTGGKTGDVLGWFIHYHIY